MILSLNRATKKTTALTPSALIEVMERACHDPAWVIERMMHGATVRIGPDVFLRRATEYEMGELQSFIKSRRSSSDLTTAAVAPAASH